MSNELLELLCNHLGVFKSSPEKSLILEDIYKRIEKISKVTEFNAILINEMIKSDLIPPIVLKRTELLSQINDNANKVERLTHKYELLKRAKASEEDLDKIAKDISTLNIETENLSFEFESFGGN